MGKRVVSGMRWWRLVGLARDTAMGLDEKIHGDISSISDDMRGVLDDMRGVVLVDCCDSIP